MTREKNYIDAHQQGISRREFLRLAGAAAVSAVLAGCARAQQSAPTTEARKPEIIRFWPDAPSKVVHTHHASVWTGTSQGGTGDNDLLNPEALRHMLDASITELTGLDDTREAWAALFRPDERVALKVNTYGGSFGGSTVFTHVPLVMAVAQALQEVGIPAEQIVIYDINTADLQGAGYPINRDGPGVRCYGSAASWDELDQGKGDYAPGWKLLNKDLSLSNILMNCDALINMPVLKTHSWSGLTFALKSHYGSINDPGRFHEGIERAIPQLNALPPIKGRTRLYIGDMLEAACLQGQWGYGDSDWLIALRGDAILMSFDPVALDTVGLQRACQLAEENEESTDWINAKAKRWLKGSAELGLGTNDPENVDLVEINLA